MHDLVRSEAIKFFTVRSWRYLAGAMVLATVVAIIVNTVIARGTLADTFEAPPGASPMQVEQMRAKFEFAHGAGAQAGSLLTSGQYLGLLLAMVVGMLIVTNEFRYGTVATTFGAVPRRGRVLLAKYSMAAIIAAGIWALATILSLAAAMYVLVSAGHGDGLVDPTALRSMGLSLVAYVCWGVFGVGVAALVRNQTLAVGGGIATYLVGSPLAAEMIGFLHGYLIKEDWVLRLVVGVPAVASRLMTAPAPDSIDDPPAWAGGLVLIAYALAAGVLGHSLIKRLDVT